MKVNKHGLADLKKLQRQASVEPPELRVKKKGKTASASHPRQAPPAGTMAQALTPEDRALFKRAVRTVQPLAPSNIAILPPTPKAHPNVLKQKRQAAAGNHVESLSQRLSDHYHPAQARLEPGNYLRAGNGPDVLKNLKRQKWPITASLDLHGATLDEARTRLEQFLQSCLSHGVKCVRIVHGKGYGSRDGTPVLKDSVRRWLTQLDAVIAFTECVEQNGGSGAVQVLLDIPKKHTTVQPAKP
jgi:DNA-nicking Smr family endonuclease